MFFVLRDLLLCVVRCLLFFRSLFFCRVLLLLLLPAASAWRSLAGSLLNRWLLPATTLMSSASSVVGTGSASQCTSQTSWQLWPTQWRQAFPQHAQCLLRDLIVFHFSFISLSLGAMRDKFPYSRNSAQLLEAGLKPAISSLGGRRLIH